MKTLEIKIVLLGPQGVGKTSIITKYCGEKIDKTISPTIGASFFSCRMLLEDYKLKLQVWDTAGQERFRTMAPMYYRNSNAAVLCYDITNRESFEDMKSWIEELKRNVENRIVMCVIGNKLDLQKDREVNKLEAQTYAEVIGAIYHETSAVTSEGIEAVFQDISIASIRLMQEVVINNMMAQEHRDTIRLTQSNNTTQVNQNLSKLPPCC